jgi:hypothetical protein
VLNILEDNEIEGEEVKRLRKMLERSEQK